MFINDARLNKSNYILFSSQFYSLLNKKFKRLSITTINFQNILSKSLGYHNYSILLQKMETPDLLKKYKHIGDFSLNEFVDLFSSESVSMFEPFWHGVFQRYLKMFYTAMLNLQANEEIIINIGNIKKYSEHKNLVYLESIINNDQALKDNLHDYIYGSYSQLTRDYIKEQFFILLDKFSVLDNKKEDYTILITEAKFKKTCQNLLKELKNYISDKISLQTIHEIMSESLKGKSFYNLKKEAEKNIYQKNFLSKYNEKDLQAFLTVIHNKKYYHSIEIVDNNFVYQIDHVDNDSWIGLKDDGFQHIIKVTINILKWLEKEDGLSINLNNFKKYLRLNHIRSIYYRLNTNDPLKNTIDIYFKYLKLNPFEPISENINDMHSWYQMQVIKVLFLIEEELSYSNIAKCNWFSFNYKYNKVYINPAFLYLIKKQPYMLTTNYQNWIMHLNANKLLNKNISSIDLIDSIINLNDPKIKSDTLILLYYLMDNQV